MDRFTETTTKSWASRIGDSFMGILIGLLLFAGSFFLLSWNEGRSIDRINTLAGARQIVVDVSSERAEPRNNGKLVYLTGLGTTNQTVSDPAFDIREKALVLRRQTEMYQWKENQETHTKTNVGGSETTETTYTYKKVWSDRLINSGDFKHPEGHDNPASMPYRSQDFYAADIHIGEFHLGESFVHQLDQDESYPVSDNSYNAMDPRMKTAFRINGENYESGDPLNPKIGDMQISYRIVMPQNLSIIGKQNGNTVQTYKINKGTIGLLGYGTLSSDELFAAAENENRLITWAARAGGFLMMWIGLSLIFRPIAVLADFIPFIGSLAGAGTGFIAGIISISLSTLTIAFSWVAVRPIFAATVVAFGVIIIAGTVLFRKRQPLAA